MGFGGLKVKFWGARDWVSAPSNANRKYGGNTACLQIMHGDKIILVDSGFGITNYGDTLFGKQNLDIHIFYTHFRWDHCQGLPFFLPIYFPANNITLHAPHPEEVIHNQLNILFDSSYSPFEGLRKMPANIHCRTLKQDDVIQGLKVNFCATHQGEKMAKQTSLDCFAYRFSVSEENSVTVALNHELNAKRDSLRKNEDLVELGAETNLLIHDAFFSPQELKTHQGWGHSSADQALQNAQAMAAKATLFAAHSPYAKDSDLDKRLRALKSKKTFKNLVFDYAREEIEYATVSGQCEPLKANDKSKKAS